MLDGSSLLILDFIKSEHIELIHNNFYLSKISKFYFMAFLGSQTKLVDKLLSDSETYVELCKYLFYIPGLFTLLLLMVSVGSIS